MGRRHGFAHLSAAITAVVVLSLMALAPAAALADGDPASDVLLGENVFYPYSPHVSASAQKSLNALTAAAAKRAGLPIKVALIASPVDLGVIPDLFGKPQKYAEFLDQEISFRRKQPLLVVMPAGYGTQGLSPKAASAIAALPKPTEEQRRTRERRIDGRDEGGRGFGASDLRRLWVGRRDEVGRRQFEQRNRDRPGSCCGDRRERARRAHAPAPAHRDRELTLVV